MLCARCNKRMAVVFVSKYEDNKTVNEGYCLKCAKELGIHQVDQIIKNMGISDEDIDNMSEEFDSMVDQMGISPDEMDSQTAPSFPPFFGNFMNNIVSSGKQPETERSAEKTDNKKEEKKQKRTDKKRKYLDQYGVNLTRNAHDGKLDPVIGRDVELTRLIRILNRRTKNNPVLIGEPGVGKTAIAEALAQKIADEQVPAKLLDKEVYLLDLTALVAGTQFRGQFEARIKGLISEVVALGNIILVIDEVHNLVGTGDSEGTMNAANILKPALSRGEIQVIGATTLSEYRKYIEKDAALERRFQPVMVDEPTINDTIEILKGIRPKYEQYHNVKISDALLAQAAIMSERYITDRFLPDKAIDLIDEACSGAALENVAQNTIVKNTRALEQIKQQLEELTGAEQNEETFKKIAELRAAECVAENALKEYTEADSVTELSFGHIAYVLELWTGIPAAKIQEQEYEKLTKLADNLKKRIIGQDKAVDAVAAAIKRRRVGIGFNRSPVSFIFTGPTGVGKTELVRRLAMELFDSVETLIRIDMSEYMEKHSVSKLIGAPPGYVGYDDAGQLTEKIRRKPYSVVLFDEIEKAHPDVLNIMLQILDDGKLTDAQGRTVNFENTVIIMTTNATAGAMNATGFNRTQEELESEKAMKALLTFLRPEFINRVDEVITFSPLQGDTVRHIAGIMLGDLRDNLKVREIEFSFDDKTLDYVSEKGFDRKFGARSLKRFIQKEVEDKIAQIIVENYMSDIKSIFCTATVDGVMLTY
ncbi:MAG: ATP-dependent Clp protease ATP-binding subunit [Clostridia bacterium]|nr:ATP-dependent Clp protease ATP-binding subunit [Clostridia bacterium]